MTLGLLSTPAGGGQDLRIPSPSASETALAPDGTSLSKVDLLDRMEAFEVVDPGDCGIRTDTPAVGRGNWVMAQVNNGPRVRDAA